MVPAILRLEHYLRTSRTLFISYLNGMYDHWRWINMRLGYLFSSLSAANMSDTIFYPTAWLCLSIFYRLSVHTYLLFVCLTVHTYLLFVCLTVHTYLPFTYPSVRTYLLPVCLSVHNYLLSVCLTIYTSVRQYLYLPMCLIVCTSVYTSVWQYLNRHTNLSTRLS